MRALNTIALILIIIGGINWGLVGLFGFDLVQAIFGGEPLRVSAPISRFVYVLVGVAALYGIYLLRPVVRGARSPGHV